MRPLSILCCLFLLILVGCGMQERREAEQRYVDSLTPEQFERYNARKMQALGIFLGSGGFQSFQQPSYQAPLYQPVPIRPPVNCMTSTTDSGAFTTCY